MVGASRGIGLEFCRNLKAKGCTVIATHRSATPPAELLALGVQHTVQLDCADPVSVKCAAADVATKLDGQGLTHLIHNAGIYGPVVSLDGHARNNRPAAPPVTKEDLMSVFEINTVGPLLVAQAFQDVLAPPDTARPILAFLTSKVGSVEDNGSGGAYAYRASKSALNIIACSLSVDLKEQADVLLLHPGYVRTDMTGGKGFIDADESVKGMLAAIEATDATVPFRWVDYKAEIVPW